MLFSGKPSSPVSGSDPATPITRTTCPCPPSCTITSQTVATIPSNRERKIIGVGEKVVLTFSLGEAFWTTTGGWLQLNKGSSVNLVAPDRNSSITITATGGGCSASINFQVIEPIGVHMEIISTLYFFTSLHQLFTISTGFDADVYITPDTVSFENIEIIEGVTRATARGFFIGTSADGMNHDAAHGAGKWRRVGQVTIDKGSKVKGYDEVFFMSLDRADFAPPYSPGTLDWFIPWSFRVLGGAKKEFTTVQQRFTIDASGTTTASKAGATISSGPYIW
jgi:hypothetical protein